MKTDEQLKQEIVSRILNIANPRRIILFGSAATETMSSDSDLDLLVEPTPETTLMDIAKIQVEVAKLLNVSVDVLTPNALPDKFRTQVLTEAAAI